MALILKDSFGRILDYIRISVTDRCNFRCRYCMPEEGIDWIPHERIMSYENIRFLVSTLEDMGVKRIRFTGGEPFVRRGFLPFITDIRRDFPSMAVAVTTNGSLLERYAEEIAALGLQSLNVSLDTLDPEKFAEITRAGDLKRVLRGIALVSAAGVPLKINTVVIRGFNLEEVPALIRYAAQNGALLRFIEFMPLDTDVWSQRQYVPANEVISLFPGPGSWLHPQEVDQNGVDTPNGPARYLRNSDTGQEVGIISAVSDHFCHTCNRLRVTSTGEIRPCLFSNAGISIIEALKDRDAGAVREAFLMAVKHKPHEGGTGLPVKNADDPVAPRRPIVCADKEEPSVDSGCSTAERHMSRIGG